jgi:hypothetical protein
MEREAMKPHVGRSNNPTATGQAIDFTRARTEIAVWAQGVKDTTERCM